MRAVVKEIIETNIAISAKKGELLFDKLNEMLLVNDAHQSKEKVIVDFDGITDLTTAFLNVGIGHLYNTFSSEELNERLEIINLDDLDIYLVNQVIERVKLNKSKDNEELELLIKEAINDGEDS